MAGTRTLPQRQNRQVFMAAAVAAGAALVLVAIVGLALPSLQVRRSELDSTAGLPVGWHKDVDSAGRTYYWNRKLGTSSWTAPMAVPRKQAAPTRTPSTHYLEQGHPRSSHHQLGAVQPLPLTVVSRDVAARPGWDQMAVPLDKLGRSKDHQGQGRMSVQPRTLQSLAPEAGAEEDGGDDEQKVAGEITPTAGWPHDLPGASGEDTSWIVGMHREPMWTDSMTHACGLTDPCPTGRADSGHGMQMDTNPYVDKRRVFDPYAYGDPYADAQTRAASVGRNNYPWDPTKDAQFYGKEGADCSDGALRDECFEKPETEDLRKKQAVWMAKYNEFVSPAAAAAAEKEEDEEKAAAEQKSEEEKAAEAEAAKQKREAAMKNDGLKGALLHMPEVTPWAHSIKTGMLSAENSLKTGMLHASAAVTATAEEAAADADQKKDQAHFVGGEPVLASLGKVVDKVKAAYKSGKGFFSKKTLTELERKFLRAHGNRQQLLSRHEAMRAFDGAALRPKKSPTTVLAAIQKPARHALSVAKSKSAQGKQMSIWESPVQVAAHGLFGSAQAAASQKQKLADEKTEKKRAAAAKVLSSVSHGKQDNGPLPQVRDEAIKVAEEAEAGAANLIKSVTDKTKAAPWEEANIQKGVLRKESTESNLMQLVKEHDDKLLQEASGLSATELKKAVHDANKESRGNKKGAVSAKALKPWEQKVAQQGTLKHETVEQNLKAALKEREKMLWKEKTGWKSIKDMQEAEAFADNLEREIKNRRKEEFSHPLIPKSANSLLHDDAPKTKSGSNKNVASDEDVKARMKMAREQRELDRLREGEPLVKALQEEVENDEQELEAESQQQRLTLKQLHVDQGKLNKQLKIEESITPNAPKVVHTKLYTHADDVMGNESEGKDVMKVSSGQQLATRKQGSGNKVGGDEPPRYGYSGARAKDDLDEYFAKQEVGNDLSHPAHKKKSH